MLSDEQIERHGRVKFRECLRDQRWLYELTAGNPEILAAVRDLIDDPVTPDYVRGLYPVFPVSPRSPEGHCDQHKFQVGVVLYLSDVLPQGGGFTVCPREPSRHGETAPHPWRERSEANLRRMRDVAAGFEEAAR